METNQPLDTNFAEGLHLNHESRGYLKETAKWARFLAILSFVMLGLFMLLGLFAGAFMSFMMADIPGAEMIPSGLITAYFLVAVLIGFFPTMYLYRFASKMNIALQNEDEIALTGSFSNIKSYYKFIGILTLIMLIFYAIALIFALIGGAMFG